ncbi:MAG: sugar ABC transporter substrate-binding protein, partial [Mesorhizobium sp.]
KNLLQNEIESLQKKIVNQQRQVDLAKEQLDSVGALAQKGLVVQTRVLNSEQTIADLQGQILDYETAILTAKQSMSKATQDATDAENTLRSSLASDRQQVETDLKEAELRVGMQKGLMTVASDPATQAAMTNSDQPALQYVLVRVVDGKTSEIAATEETPVLPGDVIKVKLAPMTSQ